MFGLNKKNLVKLPQVEIYLEVCLTVYCHLDHISVTCGITYHKYCKEMCWIGHPLVRLLHDSGTDRKVRMFRVNFCQGKRFLALKNSNSCYDWKKELFDVVITDSSFLVGGSQHHMRQPMISTNMNPIYHDCHTIHIMKKRFRVEKSSSQFLLSQTLSLWYFSFWNGVQFLETLKIIFLAKRWNEKQRILLL